VIRPPSFSFVTAAAAVLALASLAPACGSEQGAPSGTQCFSALDCAAGLVCVPKGGISTCTSNTSTIQTEVDAGADAGNAGDTGPIMLADGSLKMGMKDATAPVDTGTPPVDAGHPIDTGVPPKDTGTPPVDAGHPVDTGPPPPVDAGHPVDTGPPPVDSSAG
jgi:hypothetical protein